MPADPEPFVPAWWCRGAHAQTIASALRLVPEVPTLRRERWETRDGDFLGVDVVPAEVGRPILVMLHGLEGSSRSPQIRGFLHAAHRRRWRAIAPNFRSCSGEPNRLRRSYHAGETSDLRWVMRRLAERHPGDPMCCVGISLGGNVLLKYLGESRDAPSSLRAAAALSTPFDLAMSARAFERGALNRFYMRRLLRSLLRKTRAKLACYPDLVDARRLAAVQTIREFDEVVTAPTHGFASAQAYWTASSCRQFLPSIQHPTLLINALDDPLIPAAALPHEEVRRNSHLTGVFPASGGHAGFLSADAAHPVWSEQAVFRFFESI